MPSQPFVHLHLHSEYSLLDGACKCEKIAQRAAECGMPAVAVTDHGNLHAAIEFYQACKAAGVKPIIGMEAYVCEHDRREKREGKANTGHLVLLARNLAGFKNLVKLATRASLEGFYYHPRVDKELLSEHAEGLIALTACLGGEIPKLVLSGNLEEASARCRFYQELYSKDGFYLELQDHNTPERLYYPDQPKLNAALRAIGRELDIPLVATNDTHFMRREDFEAHQVLLCIGTQVTLDEYLKKDGGYSTEHYMKSSEEMYEFFPDDQEALENATRIAELCDVELTLDESLLPHFEVPEGQTVDTQLRMLCKRRMSELYPDPEIQAGAEHRFQHELSVIKRKGLSSYFLIVQDFLQWANEQGIISGIRGSGAGSLVSYLTGIGTVDPLQYGLWFERFLSSDRASMPDIDCDFEDRRRGEVIDYVVRKYGADHVAQVATFGTLKARAAIRDAARVLGMPISTADRLSKAVGGVDNIQQAKDTNPTVQQLIAEDPNISRLLDMAGRLEGLRRHVGVHAAAVLISRDPIVEVAPLQRTPDGTGVQTQWEMHDVVAAGLVKMDLLGLRTLTVLKDALTFIRDIHGVTLDRLHLPLDDRKTYELLARGDTAGVFQLESVGMRSVLKQMKPDRLTDIIAIVALYRPGPMATIPEFCQGKNDPTKISYLHPSLIPILQETYGVLVYQEQVMAIGRDVAGLPMEESNELLDALRKKKLDKMARLEPIFKEGVKRVSGFNNNQTEQLWDRLAEFAKYAFNKAHSACYAMVAYQTAYLKANYPVEFMAALLTSEMGDRDKIALHVAESHKLGIEVLPPDVNASGVGFAIEDGKIRFGLTAIKGVGVGAVESMVRARIADGPFVDLFDFCARVENGACNRLTMEALVKSGAMDGLPGNRAQKLAVLDPAIEMGQSIARDRCVGQISLFGGLSSGSHPVAPKLPDLDEYDPQARLQMEREYLGLFISAHPMDEHREAIDAVRTASVEELADANEGDEIVLGGMVASVKPYTTRDNKRMAFASFTDQTGTVEVTVFADLWEKAQALLTPDAVLLLKGRVNFGMQRTVAPATDDEDADKPEAKLIAIATARPDDEEAVRALLAASGRRRGNSSYGNSANGNGWGKAQPTAINIPLYVAPTPESPIPGPTSQYDEMPTYRGEYDMADVIREHSDTPPPIDADAPPVGEFSPPLICRIHLPEEFVVSEDFTSLPSVLAGCKGEAPVEIVVEGPNGRRIFQLPSHSVNLTQAGKLLGALKGRGVDVEGI